MFAVWTNESMLLGYYVQNSYGRILPDMKSLHVYIKKYFFSDEFVLLNDQRI